MGYLCFSSKNADYIYCGGNGAQKHEAVPDAAKSVDGIVLERGASCDAVTDLFNVISTVGKKKIEKGKLDEILARAKTEPLKPIPIEEIFDHEKSTHKAYVQHAFDKKLPVFIAEPYTNEMLKPISQQPKNEVHFQIMTPVYLGISMFPNVNVPGFVADFMYRNDKNLDNFMVYKRNAIVAERTEKIFVPFVEGSIKRKPKILIRYDSGHMGIKRFFEDEAERTAVIKKWLKAGSPKLAKGGDFVYIGLPTKDSWRVTGSRVSFS